MNFLKRKPRKAIIVFDYWQTTVTGKGNAVFNIEGKLTEELFRSIEKTLCENTSSTRVAISNIIWLEG
jgi:hypothetical protein